MSEIATVVTAPVWPDEPYRGLNYYSAVDAPLFSQRERESDDCADLFAATGTKILVLHGRSGVGKSSFLRAGLIPRLLRLRPGYRFLRQGDGTGEPIFIRSTHNPVHRILEELGRAITRDPEMRAILADHMELTEAADWQGVERQRKRADRCLRILEALSAGLPQTLALVIDQGEEVLTEPPGPEHDARRRAFFHFLMRVQRLDVKLIIALRTEYHGRFFDLLKLTPQFGGAPRAGVAQFLLNGLCELEQVEAAIIRPTLREVVQVNGEPFGVPYQRYGFRYDDGVAARIAQDLLGQCGEASTLPVMQIVCRSLYQQVVRGTGAHVITHAAYESLGGVKGRIDAYVDEAIRSALSAGGSPPARYQVVDAWRAVLATLVFRQTDGSAAARLRPEEALHHEARMHGIESNIVHALGLMCEERWRLLRTMAIRNPDGSERRFYSLVHDATGLALCRWSEERETAERQKSHYQRQLRRIVGGCIGATALTAFLFVQNVYAPRRSDMIRFQSYATAESNPDFRLRILLLLAAIRKAGGLNHLFLDDTQAIEALRKVLLRAPYIGGSFAAIGISDDGKQVAVIDGEMADRLRILDATPEDAGHRVHGAERWQQVAAWTPTPPKSGHSSILPARLAVGFMAGVEGPVVYKDGHLWHSAQGKGRWEDLSPHVPEGFKTLMGGTQLSMGEFAAGCLQFFARLAPADGRNRIAVLRICADVGEDGPRFRALAHDPRLLTWPLGEAWPTFSALSHHYAYVDSGVAQNATDPPAKFPGKPGSRRVVVGSVENPTETVDLPLGETSSNLGQTPPLAFADSPGSVVIRETEKRLQVIRQPATAGPSSPVSETIFVPPEAAQATVSRGQWRTTLLAAAWQPGEWRFAWLVRNGVAVVRKEPADVARIGFGAPLFSGIDGPAYRLRFSPDGQRLFMTSGPWGKQQLHIWDLREKDREREIQQWSVTELVSEACRVAALDPAPDQAGARFTHGELLAWFGQADAASQPCATSE